MNGPSPPVLCIVGRKNSGKTGLTVALSGELNRRGYRVMTAKHGHGFRLDQPGKDSWRHRHEGGAVRTVMASPRDFAVVGGWPVEELPLEALVRWFLSDADVVLAEGFKGSSEPGIEIFRKGTAPGPLFHPDEPGAERTVALVADDPALRLPIPVFPLDAEGFPGALADFVEEVLALKRPER